MTDKMPREEIIRRLRVLAVCRTGPPPPIEENHWLGDNMWVIGIGELAAAAADLLEATGPAAREDVRAVVEMLWEPSDVMLDQAMAPYIYKIDEKFRRAMRDSIAEYWRSMISTLLTEPHSVENPPDQPCPGT